jgi:hypothetical protein
MREQFEYLTEAAASSRITVQVVPHGVHPGVLSPFVMASLGAGNGEVAYVETAVRGQIARNPEDLEVLTDLWESIQACALPQRESLQLISRTADEKWT